MALIYSIGSTGVIVPTQAQLLAYFQQQFLSIYGVDLSTQDPSSPDNQMTNILVQSLLDVSDLLVETYNMFDPDNAIGVVLDQRVAINGIQRQAGSYTVTNITLVTSQSLNLYGIDQAVQPIYTVADNAGNEWQLITSQVGLVAGTHILSFQSAVPGAILTIPNTITVPVTIVLGVTSINNPTTYSSLGVNEESDNALKIRRQKSVSLSSQGYLAGLLAALENIPGVTFAFVEENTTATTNGDGVPGHSIWVIVAGSAAATDIANAIYTKRNAGCGMYGSVSYIITQVDGTSFLVSWDVVVTVPLFIKFTASSLDGINPPKIAAIKNGLPAIFTPGVSSTVNINDLATFVRDLDPNALVTSSGFSLTSGGAYTNTLTPATKKNQFVVSSADVIILPMILAGAAGQIGIGYVFSGSGAVTGTTLTIANTGHTFSFAGLGGFGALTYAKVSGAGAINASTGVYTSAGAGTDVVSVTDSLGNTTNCTITVT